MTGIKATKRPQSSQPFTTNRCRTRTSFCKRMLVFLPILHMMVYVLIDILDIQDIFRFIGSKKPIDLLELETARLGEVEVHDGHEARVEDGIDDIVPPPNVGQADRGHLHYHEVDDPVDGRGEGSAALAELEGEDFGWVNPDRGLEPSREAAHVKEEHDGRPDASRVCALVALLAFGSLIFNVG